MIIDASASSTTIQYENSELASAIARTWWMPGGPPSLRQVRRIVTDNPDNDKEAAWIVCFGQVAVPPPGEYRFEPEVVSPTRAVAGHFSMMACGLLMGILLLVLSPLLPIPRRTVIIGAVLSGITGALIPALYWMIRSAVRPAYLRIAPGIVQVFSYRLFSSRPRVHSYPVTAGDLW